MEETISDLVCPACGTTGSEAFCPRDGQKRVAAATLAPRDPLLGKVIAGRYAIERRLGQGAMGAVYLATQALIGRPVVVKVMRAEVAGDQGLRARFLREAQAASRVTHPNIITIHDFGYEEGMGYMVMEHVDGPSLDGVLDQEGRVGWRRAAKIVAQVARALDAAHRSGVVHRDVKPANVMLTRHDGEQDFVKVLDFGVARVLESGGVRLTSTGAIMGTPAYMAPEQVAGREVGAAADVYALGVMLFDLVAGTIPFKADSVTDVLMMHLHMPPPRLGSVADDLVLPEALEQLVAACLAKKPASRPPAIEVAEELERIARGDGAASRFARPMDMADPAALIGTADGTPALVVERPVTPSAVALTAPPASAVTDPPDGVVAAPPVSGEKRRPISPAAIVAVLAVVAIGALVFWQGASRDDAPDASAPTTDAVASEDASAPAPTADAAAAVEVAPRALPAIPKRRGMRLDGMPIE